MKIEKSAIKSTNMTTPSLARSLSLPTAIIPIATTPTPLLPPILSNIPQSAPPIPSQKPRVWWIFTPFEIFFSFFPDFTPYFDFFYFSVHTFILIFGIIIMFYSYKINELSYLSILMLYVGIRRPAWYIFYLYVLLWVGIADLLKIVYNHPPWKMEWPTMDELDTKLGYKTVPKKKQINRWLIKIKYLMM